jgi:uncharacterized protein
MLKVELRSLEQEDLVLEETSWPHSLGLDLAPELSREPLAIFCQISKSGDLISVKGWVQSKMLLTCGRCLKEFETPYKSFFEVHYRPQYEGGPEEKDSIPEGEVEIVVFEGDVLDIGDQIRQTVILSVPMRALCRDDCRGLCSGCGYDLNLEACRCTEPPSDSRWEALRKWKSG